ncbi:hypothetical protein EDD15DRAFT_2268174 [Pisolithus albus]|nr:hypothetical protein EDD15DRAFT_2268174 [Pisolithus albus]
MFWEILYVTTLAGLRQRFLYLEEWHTQEVARRCWLLLAPRYELWEISTPLCRLNGTTTPIVNAVAIHPSQLHIITSGVERDMHDACRVLRLISPTLLHLKEEVAECNPEDEIRFFGVLLGMHPTPHEGAIGQSHDGSHTISLFDQRLVMGHILHSNVNLPKMMGNSILREQGCFWTEEDDDGVIDIMRSP